MISLDEMRALIQGIRDSLDESQGAIISDQLTQVMSEYNNALDEVESRNTQISNLTTENAELLKTNNNLFRKIGFDDDEEKKPNDNVEDDELTIDDVVNEKGELI